LVLDIDLRTLNVLSVNGVIEGVEHFAGAYDDDYLHEAQAFLNCIEGHAKPACDGRQGLAVLQQVMAVRTISGLT
jgi:predicted dehydrogenase